MIKNSQINALLIQIDGTLSVKNEDGTTTTKGIGLLNEECGLGLKRKLRKIQKELFEHFAQFKTDLTEVEKIEDADKKKEETEKLLSESFELKAEKVMMSEIEKINSSFPYDFELLELIAE